MKIQNALFGIAAMLMLAPLSVHAASPDAAKPDVCALHKPADMTALVGGTPVGNAKGVACTWTSSASKHTVIVTQSPQIGMSSDMTFTNAQKNASKNPSFSNEAGIGDKAFSLLVPAGVSLVAFKNGHLLQFQYKTGAQGTAKDLDALRPVAKKAMATF